MNTMKYAVRVIVIIINIGWFIPAFPHGLGLYINGSGGLSRNEAGRYYMLDGPVSLGGSHGRNYDGAVAGYGCGIIMDTDPDSDRLFNYRISAGYERMHVLVHNMINLHAIRWGNTFGFRLYRSDALKLWLGPRLGLDFLWGRDAHTTREIVYNYMLMAPPFNGYQPVWYMRRYRLMCVNAGLALGVNMSLAKSVMLSVELHAGVFNTFSLKEIDTIPPSGNIKGFEGNILVGVLGQVN